jgi:TonB-dependent SusC/RagA subfamily outer membrane receptor
MTHRSRTSPKDNFMRRMFWPAALAALLFAAAQPLLSPANAQASAVGTITGRVTDSSSGQPVPRAQVTVNGIVLGQATDDNGRFSISGVAAGEHQVTARRVGYAPVTRRVQVAGGGSVTLDFSLGRAATVLSEVVTVATGEQARYQIGHAIASLRPDSIAKTAPVFTLSDVIANRIPGAFINGLNGLTGTVSPIRLRGLNSFTVSNNPIVILDGARIEATPTNQATGGNFNGSSRLGDLNLNEIESVDVVKGPSAATLYGTDAANGVLIIKTKRGQPGNLRWSGFGEGGTIRADTDHYPLNYYGWGHSVANGRVVPCALTAVGAGTCIQDSITTFSPLTDPRTTPVAPGNRGNAGLQASGGSGQLRYLLSGGWEQETGWMRMPEIEQTRIKAVQGLTEIPEWQLRPNYLNKVNVRGNLTAAFGAKGDLTLSNGLVRQTFRQTTTEAFRAGYWGTGYNDSTSHGYAFGDQIGDFFQLKTQDVVTRYISSVAGNYRPMEWLTTRATFGIDFSNAVNDNLQMNGQGPPGVNRTGNRLLGSNDITQITFDGGATAARALLSSLSSKTSVGVQYNRRSQVYGATTGVGLPPGSQTLVGAAALTTTETHADAIVYGSYVQQEFGWHDRLFATAAFRADGASTFGQDFNTTIYPKVSLSWVASDEPGLPKIPGVGSLRFRAAFGSSGVQPPSTASVTAVSIQSAIFNGVTTSGVINSTSVGNPTIGPERQTEL